MRSDVNDLANEQKSGRFAEANIAPIKSPAPITAPGENAIRLRRKAAACGDDFLASLVAA